MVLKSKKTIAIDVRPLYDGNAVRGVGYYTKMLTKSIGQELSTNPDFKDFEVILLEKPDDNPRYDLIHYPYFDPFYLTLPPKPDKPFIVTIHDLIPIEYSPHFPPGLKGYIRWHIQKHRVKKAKYILTVSATSKHVIKDILGYPEDRIFFAHLAADDSFKPRPNSDPILKKIRQKYNLPDKFVLFNGDLNWNKNVPFLIKACLNLNYPIVIVGSSAAKPAPDHPWTKDLRWMQDMAFKPENKSKIILPGFVPDDEFPLFFNLATLYCQPSIAEGFGLPLVQAMKSGCPICYSTADAVSEVMNYCGLFFDPFSSREIELSLTKMWQSKTVRNQYIKKGLLRSQNFNWKFTAIQTLNLYRLALIDEK